MAVKLTLILCVVAICAVDYAQCASPKQAPAPAVDCSSLILNMADCLSFVQNGSTVTKPEGTCCTGLKSVLKADAGCLCEAFKSSAQLGVVLNVTKASTLPTACKVSAPSISKCECEYSCLIALLGFLHSTFRLFFEEFFCREFFFSFCSRFFNYKRFITFIL